MKRSNAWKGGRIVTDRGYIKVWDPDHPLAHKTGYVYEHRKVVYDAGIPVPADHHVHHVDGNRTNNELSNLEVIDGVEHYQQHKAAGAMVTNQFGTFPILTPEERAERNRKRCREYSAKRRAERKAVA